MHYNEKWALNNSMLESSSTIALHPHVGATMPRIATGFIQEDGWPRMFRCSVGPKISMPLLYDVRLLIYVPLVLMFSVPEPHLPENLMQCTSTPSKELPGFELSQE